MTRPPSLAHHTPSTFSACSLCARFFTCKKGLCSCTGSCEGHTGSYEGQRFLAPMALARILDE